MQRRQRIAIIVFALAAILGILYQRDNIHAGEHLSLDGTRIRSVRLVPRNGEDGIDLAEVEMRLNDPASRELASALAAGLSSAERIERHRCRPFAYLDVRYGFRTHRFGILPGHDPGFIEITLGDAYWRLKSAGLSPTLESLGVPRSAVGGVDAGQNERRRTGPARLGAPERLD